MYEFLVCSMINEYVFMHMIPPIFQSILSNLSNILLFDLDITYPKTDKVDKIQTPPSPQFNLRPKTPIKICLLKTPI